MINRKILKLLVIFFAYASFELVHSMQQMSPEERQREIDRIQRVIERLKNLRGPNGGSELLESHIRELQEKIEKL